MSSRGYVLEAYKLSFRFRESKVHTVTVPKVILQPLLNFLFISGITHSKPMKLPNESLYLIYIVGDNDTINRVKDFIKEHDPKSELPVNMGGGGSVSSLDDSIKGDMAYRAVRQYIYRRLGFRRGSGQKLYDISKIVQSHDNILNVFQAYVVSHDVISNSSYVFVDAARKLEFAATLRDLETKGKLGTSSKIQWVKIRDSTVSFYIEPDIDFKKFGRSSDKVVNTLKYIVKSRYIPLDIDKIDSSDVVALTPKSAGLRLELHRKGYTVTIGDKEVVFLPKNVLVPVASMDNVSTLLQEYITLKFGPTTRHKEVYDLVRKLSSDIEIGNVSIALDPHPLEIKTGKVPPNELYIDLKDSGNQDTEKVTFDWSPYELLKKIVDKLLIYVLYSKGDKDSYRAADLIRRELHKNLDVMPQMLEIDFGDVYVRDSRKIERQLEYITETAKGVNCAVLVIGPGSIDAREDRDLRNKVEKVFRFRGLFCWYISITSIIPKRREEERKFRNVLSRKLLVVMKELAIRLQLFSHKLQPLQLSKIDGGTDVFDAIAAADATVIGMERSQLRIGAVLILMNLSRGSYTIETDTYEINESGEDPTLAKTIKKALEQLQDTKLIIYVNRARPEALLNYLQEDEVRELLNNAVIVGATKTHTYSRILKKVNDVSFSNPELTTYYQLYTRDLKELRNARAKISRYLAITTTAQFEVGERLTVKPTLLSIILNKDIWRSENIDKVLKYTLTLCTLNNTTTWVHSLPWPLHRVDRILKNAHRLAEDRNDFIKALEDKDIVKTL